MRVNDQIPASELNTTDALIRYTLTGKVFKYLEDNAPAVENEILKNDDQRYGVVFNKKFADVAKIIYSENLTDAISILENYDASVPSDVLRKFGMCALDRISPAMSFQWKSDFGVKDYGAAKVKFAEAVHATVECRKWYFQQLSSDLMSNNSTWAGHSRYDMVLIPNLRRAIKELIDETTRMNLRVITFWWEGLGKGNFDKGDLSRWKYILTKEEYTNGISQ